MTDAIAQARRDWLASSFYSAGEVAEMSDVRAEYEVAVHYPGGNGAFVRDAMQHIGCPIHT